MNTDRITILVVILKQIQGNLGAVCNSNREIGEDNPQSKQQSLDSAAGTAVLLFQPEFQFDCCGYVYKWEFSADSGYSSGTFDAQVWRQQSGLIYSLVGANTLTPTNAGSNEEHSITNGQRIRVDNGDYIGLHSTGNFIITHKFEGGTGIINVRWQLTGITSTMTVTSSTDWSSASTQREDYAINAFVTPGSAPTVSGISTVTLYNDATSVGQVVKSLTPTDSDTEDISDLVLTIQSISNSGTTYFEMASGSNDITVKASPVPVKTYTVTLHIIDFCGLSSTPTQQISIINRDPVINNLPDSVSISEDSTAGLIFTIDATDTVTSLVTSSMTAGDSSRFEVKLIPSTTNYGVYVKSSATFDYDIVSSYTVTVRADDGDDTVNAVLTINLIRNDPPVINSLPASTSFLEDVNTRTLLHTVIVTDVNGDNITCSLNPSSSLFEVAIIPSTTDYGIYLKGGTTLDYDTISSYVVNVECADNRRSDTESFTINLIRNTPPVINCLPASTSFLEDVNTRTLLHTVIVTDVNGDSITCSLNPSSVLFNVSVIPSTTDYGIYLTGGTTLDYDTTSSYVLSVVCADHRRSDTEIFTINLIRNTPPVIDNLPNSTSISEDLSTRTLLHTLIVTDVNVADNHTCGLNTHTTLFEVTIISADDYGVFVKSGVTLDYDTTSSYILSITCSDHRRGVSGDFTVYILRNEPPSITNLPMSTEIPEDTSSETLLYTVSVTDPTNDTVTCSITTTTSIFYMQIGSNQFEYKIYIRSNQALQYDTQPSYTLSILGADQRRNVTADFFIYLLRNMPPKFSNLQGKITVAALTTLVGQTVFTVLAEDPENDQLQFSMTSLASDPPFVINTNTGEISLSRSITTESVPGYDMALNVTDGRNIFGPTTLTIRITGINSPPTLKNLPQTVLVLESLTTIGTSIFTPLIEDKDVSHSHTHSVIFFPPEGAVYFGVNSANGQITTLVDIDYETISTKTFSLAITVTDSYMSDNGTLTVNIIDVNEAPKFTKKVYTFSASEDNAGTVLQNPYYQSTDEDGDVVKFSCDCGSDTGRLDMDSSTGFFSYAVNYDIDDTNMASLIQCQVTISDNEYSDVASLNISILDVNDNSPVFQHKEYTFFVSVDSAVGTVIGQVLATDDDVGTNGDLIYHVEQGNAVSGLFAVSGTGTLTVAQSLSSYTEGSLLNFTVYAVDTGSRQDSTSVTVVFPDTTVTTTPVDNTIQYMTFFTYAPNMAWFVPLLCLLAGMLCVVAYTIWTTKCDCCESKGNNRRSIRKQKQRRLKPTRRPNRV